MSFCNPPPSLAEIMRSMKKGGRVGDVGCFGWRLADLCAQGALALTGFDMAPPPRRPEGVDFGYMKGSELEAADGGFELMVASHVIEHLDEPVKLVEEMARLLRPGGLVWLEAPSELSCVARSSDDAEDHRFENFWDDPTHKRPYTPGALYRLMLSAGIYPWAWGRVDEGIPSSRVIGRKPDSMVGHLGSRYVSLKECGAGVGQAWSFVWPEIVLSAEDKAGFTENN
jgi:SAM-dependent methyltransferase